MNARIFVSVVASFCILHSAFLYAAPGDLDPTFAGTGKTRIGFGGGPDYGQAAAVQPDGKLVLAGYSTSPAGGSVFETARFGTNIVLDATFGEGGEVATRVGSVNLAGARLSALGIQADGKIVAAGAADGGAGYLDFTLVRYLPDGSLDQTFGTNGTGIVCTDFGYASGINAMLIQPDGKIVVAGVDQNGLDSFTLARYDTNGVLDTTFGGYGRVFAPYFYGTAYGLMRQSDGSIVAVGRNEDSGAFAIVRYTANGVLDTNFNGTGEVFTQNGKATAVALQRGGPFGGPDKIVVAGIVYSTQNTFGILRYNLDGTPDTTFGTHGVVLNPVSPGFDSESAQAVLLQESYLLQGTIVHIMVAGVASVSYTNEFLLAHYNGDGSPDTAFGTEGDGKEKLLLGAGYQYAAYAMAFQAGKVVAAGSVGGDLGAIRVNTDGSLDPTFGNGGIVTADIANLNSAANAVAMQSDGRIVLGGKASFGILDRIALCRYQPDGTLDASFGLNGRLTTATSPTNSSGANALAIQPDGKIVVAGGLSGGGIAGHFLVARYETNGARDNLFGTNGVVITAFGTNRAEANALAIQPDGKIVVAGSTYSGANDNFAVVRYTTSGKLDATFAGAGFVNEDIAGGDDEGEAAGIQQDGKIVVAGFAQVGSGTNFALLRLNADGSPDSSFGTLGKTTTDFGNGTSAFGYGLAIAPDGKIIVAGTAVMGGNPYIALARYQTNGQLDASFDGTGKVMMQTGYSVRSLALQPDGRILAAGADQTGTYEQYVVLRFNSDGSLDASFGTGGEVPVSFDDGGNDAATAVASDPMGRAVVVGDANNLFGVARLLGGIPLTISLTSPTAVKVSWPYPSTGWNLQQNSDLSASNWETPSETINNDGTNNFIIVSPPAGNRFYRLFKP